MGTGPVAGKRVTIRDVARSAGVSYQTVSRALNDKPEIDATTKQRVLDAARELGFRPSRFARGLVRQDTTSIGLVIPDLLNPFFTEVASAALEAARRRGWHVVVYDTADDPEQELSTLRVIGSQVDAIVGYLSGPADTIDTHTSGIPVVHIGRTRPGSGHGAIVVDGEQAVHAAIDHLVGTGRGMIGMLDHDRPGEPSVRQGWFHDALRAHGRTGPVVGAAQSVDGGQRGLAALLAVQPRLDGLFTYNDVIGIGALREARRRGLDVPGELAVIGFDGLEIGTIVEPPLSSVRIDTRRLGTMAVEQVAAMLAGEPAATTVIVGELLLRGSS
ncbi:LacI family DNA-binding transcriptional regulator [Pseudonocardia sp. GCM10023141]|uniref:LacI family DNA-binding transcriptional regulator n=1 Tax=Pseudonocardia sp. GCM10023141 TaxID=3252653 RepID=UPI003615F974